MHAIRVWVNTLGGRPLDAEWFRGDWLTWESTMSGIKPALTVEEWSLAPDLEMMTGGFTLATNIGPTDAGLRIDRHGAAAMCLYGQPFGFTREDVALLRQYPPWNGFPVGENPGIGSALISLADRIEALLPPE